MLINRQRRVPIAREPLEAFLQRVRSTLRLDHRQVTVCLLSDSSMARLNRAYRGKAGPPDVLSFPANGAARPRRSRASASSASYLGDVAISPQTARRNAPRFGRTFLQELRILILHGVLHLLGYDHETDRGRMHRVERRLRAQLGLR